MEVLMREKCHPAILRWQPQGQRIFPGGTQGERNRHRLFLRLQAQLQWSIVRRHPSEALAANITMCGHEPARFVEGDLQNRRAHRVRVGSCNSAHREACRPVGADNSRACSIRHPAPKPARIKSSPPSGRGPESPRVESNVIDVSACRT